MRGHGEWAAALAPEPRQRHRRDPVRRGRPVLQLPPLRRQWQHRIDLVAHLIEGARIDQAPAVRRLRPQATVSYPAAHGPRTPPDPLRRFGNREHGSILRPRPDEAARRVSSALRPAARRAPRKGTPATIAPNRLPEQSTTTLASCSWTSRPRPESTTKDLELRRRALAAAVGRSYLPSSTVCYWRLEGDYD
jgi:hypothetical protein